MKKRILCFILCLCMILPVLCLPASATDNRCNIPVIYVMGSGFSLAVFKENNAKQTVFPLRLPEDYVENAVKQNIDVFLKAVATQEWDEFCDVLCDLMEPVFRDVVLDENGNAPNGSVADFTWSRKTLRRATNGTYAFDQYTFNYDFRMDPLKTADTLHKYIEDVKAVTGAAKVALCGRCLGACIVAAYLTKYGHEDISHVILCASALYGSTVCSKAFCGELYLDSDGIERYIYDYDLLSQEYLNTFIRSFVTLSNMANGLDVAAWSVNNVYPKIYLNIVPRMLRESYGTFPGYWSMVSDEDYIKAKDTVFFGADMDKWSNFIDIIDNYHYNVQCNAKNLLKQLEKDGVPVFNIAKYGRQTIPVTEDANILSDGFVSLVQGSIGATVTDINTVFSQEYSEAAQRAGTEKYISPDKQIDASTCLLRDRTWFIKDINHKAFPDSLEQFMAYLVNADNPTVFNTAPYPQYLIYDSETDTISPLTVHNMDSEDWKIDLVSFFHNLFRAFHDMFSAFFTEMFCEKMIA